MPPRAEHRNLPAGPPQRSKRCRTNRSPRPWATWSPPPLLEAVEQRAAHSVSLLPAPATLVTPGPP
eukprot:957873-Alexandrium_andersonii.AAC.1